MLLLLFMGSRFVRRCTDSAALGGVTILFCFGVFAFFCSCGNHTGQHAQSNTVCLAGGPPPRDMEDGSSATAQLSMLAGIHVRLNHVLWRMSHKRLMGASNKSIMVKSSGEMVNWQRG